MLYDKLPIVFLSTLASEKKDSTNSQIASYLLNHLEEIKDIGIQDMAKECHVAMSSISRFCKEIGLHDFNELRELLVSTNMNFEQNSLSSSGGERLKAYSLKVKESIEMVEYSIDIKQIDLLCQEIKRYEKVAAFGLLKAGTIAFNLQTDLLMLGKQIYSNISYKQQLQYILSSTKEDLIIIFSYTGCYFDYPDLRALKNKLNAPQIWLISSKQETYPEFIDHVITFDSLQDQNSHPYQLQFIAGLIGQEYARIV